MFKYVRHGYLSFKFRSVRILHEIRESNSDIICLQEVDHFDDFYKPRLEELGYDLHTTFRREKDAVLIGFKKELLTIVEKEIVEYNDLANIHGEVAKELNLNPNDLL